MKFKNDTTLLFKLPYSLKKDFDYICTEDRTRMTYELNHFIKEFVQSKLNEDPEKYTRQQWSVG